MIIQFDELTDLRKKYCKSKISLTVGSFDVLHMGHVKYLRRVKSMGDVLVVGIDSDIRVKEQKGDQRPIFDELNRAKLIDSLEIVDFVLITPSRFKQKDMPTLQLIKKLKPDIFVAIIDKWKQFETIINKYEATLKIIKRSNRDSTTNIIQKIKNLR